MDVAVTDRAAAFQEQTGELGESEITEGLKFAYRLPIMEQSHVWWLAC